MSGRGKTIQSQDTRARLKALCGLMAVIIISVVPFGKLVASGDSMRALVTREIFWWFCAASILAWLHFAERLPLASIGLRRPTWKSPLYALLAAVALLVIFFLDFAVIVPAFHLNVTTPNAVRNMILAQPFLFRLFLVLRAAVVEEIIFRGYLIEKVRQLTGSTVLAVIVSVAPFGYAHLSGWGPVQLIPVFGAAVVLALLYVWKRDLPSNMLAHFLTDGAGFLLH